MFVKKNKLMQGSCVLECVDDNDFVNARLNAIGFFGGCNVALGIYSCDTYIISWNSLVSDACCQSCEKISTKGNLQK